MKTCNTCKYGGESWCKHPSATVKSPQDGMEIKFTPYQLRVQHLNYLQCGYTGLWHEPKDPDEGYRWIKAGETREEGDQQRSESWVWSDVTQYFGVTYTKSQEGWYRRPIKPKIVCPVCGAKVTIFPSMIRCEKCDFRTSESHWQSISDCLGKYWPGAGYQWLSVNDVTRDGDELRIENGWMPQIANCIVAKEFTTRRKL